jgi:hypothetical protein
MFLKLLERFLTFLENRGRRYGLVGIHGDCVAYKYFPVYKELAGRDKFWPNVFFHRFIRPGAIDGEDLIHSHPYNSLSIILQGSYTEYCKETESIFVRKAGSFRFMRSTDRHSIITMEPDTLTVFIRGFKKKDWVVGIRPCAVVCDRCKGTVGHCEKEDKTVSADDLLEYPEDGGKWRGWRWVKWTPSMDSMLHRRKMAMERSGLEIKPIVEITELKER